MKSVAPILLGTLTLGLAACSSADTASPAEEGLAQSAQELRHDGGPGATFSVFSFTSTVSTSGKYTDGDVRLDSVTRGDKTWSQDDLQKVESAKILVEDGVDEARGGHNLASGQGISSTLDGWEDEGPATITPTSRDLAESLGNFNLTSIAVTRENVGTASVEIRFPKPSSQFFFWERGATTSPTGANSDVLVEALNERGRVVASHKLLRTEYTATGISITTWNGSFSSPSTPGGTPPVLGSAGLVLDTAVARLRLTSVQEAAPGTRDDGPDYKVIAAEPERGRDHEHESH